MVNGAAKIVGGHRDRLAVVYLRQSSMAQVREHTESTMRQYGLVEEAVRLGWAREAVVVIDTDLGVSGRWGVARAGFAELVSRVCTGEVGAIFGIEISRLARSNAEVARLMEFAAITETLLIDADGVYDPGDVNDRMLLGLKSTMGEVELRVMAQRLQAAKRAAAARGELRVPLPVGYLHDEAGAVVIDPDAEVQAAIRDVFAAFTACGSAYGVVAAFAGRRFPLRAYGGVWAGQLRWGALTHARVLGILKNPCYAGVYVHGRYTCRRTVDPDGTVHTGLIERPRSQWPVLITDHHDGYIGWADYLANEARLAANRTNTGARPPREGSALCQGIIVCGSCGTPMHTNYHTDQRPAYECSRRADRLTTPTCRSVVASTVDTAVAQRLLSALDPTEVALALAAADAVADRRHRVNRAAELAVERARYDADRAEAPSTLSSRKTVWSHGLWKHGGRPSSPHWPTPNTHSRQPKTPRHRYRAEPNSNGSPPTCPHSGTVPPPATRTVNGCCAPSSPTSPCSPNPTSARCGSGSAGTPAPPTTSPSRVLPTPAPPNAARRPPST